MSAPDLVALVRVLAAAKVEFIIVGGVAANLLGSARTTIDLDVVYRRTDENLNRVAKALSPLEPYLRGVPPGLPFTLDADTLRRGLNFTLTTTAGAVDLLGEITGGGTYENLIDDCETVRLSDVEAHCLSLRRLIATKRAAGRPKDLVALSELEALLEERDKLR